MLLSEIGFCGFLFTDSDIVEFNGYAESEGGYYGEHYLAGFIVIKCHECGNAFKIDRYSMNPLNTDGNNIERFHDGIK